MYLIKIHIYWDMTPFDWSIFPVVSEKILFKNLQGVTYNKI